MKLKSLMDSNTAKYSKKPIKKIKQAKFADIGMKFLNNKKKGQGNKGENQHSE